MRGISPESLTAALLPAEIHHRTSQSHLKPQKSDAGFKSSTRDRDKDRETSISQRFRVMQLTSTANRELHLLSLTFVSAEVYA